MTIGTVIGKPISLVLDLSILSERVINSISRIDNLSAEDRKIFKKAADFLEGVLRGGDAVSRLELSATSGRDLESFGLVANAYKISGRRPSLQEQHSRTHQINKLLITAKQLAEGTSLPTTRDVKALHDLFQSAKAITKSLTAGEIDRVKIS